MLVARHLGLAEPLTILARAYERIYEMVDAIKIGRIPIVVAQIV
jgi:hypothetical protein